MSQAMRLFLQSLAALGVFVVAAAWLRASQSAGRAVAAFAIAAVAAWGVAWFAARRQRATIRQLSDAARALATGDLSEPAPLAAAGELGELADALRGVAEHLGSRLMALQGEDALLSALIESLNEGVIAMDARQRVVRMNRAGRDILRLGDAQLPIGVDALPRDALLHRALQGALRGSSTGPVEVTVGERIVALTATPLGDGGTGGAVIAMFDLTQLRRLEQIRRDFVANVSHELRTPLTVVSGFAEALAEDEPPLEQRRQFVDAIRNHTVRMQRIVDDLLDLSRMESRGWVPNPEQVELQSLFEETVATAQGEAAGKEVTIRHEPPGEVPVITADRTALRQILSNLIENSLRHTETGEVVMFAEPAPDGVWVGVRDTGVGIAPEHLPRIFERFYRADSARTRKKGGTGLGLAIVKHLAEAHGGTVRAESQVGEGTTVAVFLPR
jgi:two-component system, OmpR family, phosphate regulon sensor histidine kinase PhoR